MPQPSAIIPALPKASPAPISIGADDEVVTEDDAITIRHMMYLSFTFDHRILDGAGASRVVQAVRTKLQSYGRDINVYYQCVLSMCIKEKAMPEQREMAPVSQQEKDAPGMQTFDPIDCFKQMILARTINDVLKTRKTQGKIDFYIGCAGHEAIAGVIAALQPDDWLSLSYRDLAAWLQRTRDPYAPVRAAYARTTDPMSSGRGLASLYSSHRSHIMPTFAEIGAMAPFSTGVAFVFKRNQSGQVISYHCGDGGVAGTNQFNVLYRAATLYNLPVIMVVEDNGWAITYGGNSGEAAWSSGRVRQAPSCFTSRWAYSTPIPAAPISMPIVAPLKSKRRKRHAIPSQIPDDT